VEAFELLLPPGATRSSPLNTLSTMSHVPEFIVKGISMYDFDSLELLKEGFKGFKRVYKSVGLMVVGRCLWRNRLPVGFRVPVDVVPDVAWNFVHHTTPYSCVALDPTFKLFASHSV